MFSIVIWAYCNLMGLLENPDVIRIASNPLCNVTAGLKQLDRKTRFRQANWIYTDVVVSICLLSSSGVLILSSRFLTLPCVMSTKVVCQSKLYFIRHYSPIYPKCCSFSLSSRPVNNCTKGMYDPPYLTPIGSYNS